MTLDHTGNIHRPAGSPAGGQFAPRSNSAPIAQLTTSPWAPGAPKPAGIPLPTVAPHELVRGDEVDLSALWTEEYDPRLHAFASTEYAQVEAVEQLPNGRVMIFLFDAPSNAIAPADVRLPVKRF